MAINKDMESAKNIIFILPLDEVVGNAKDKLASEKELQTHSLEASAEGVQGVVDLCPGLILHSDIKKCSDFLVKFRQYLSLTSSKVLLYQSKEIPQRVRDSLLTLGLSDTVDGNVNVKSLIYKAKFLLKSIPLLPEDELLEKQAIFRGAMDKIVKHEKMRLERGIIGSPSGDLKAGKLIGAKEPKFMELKTARDFIKGKSEDDMNLRETFGLEMDQYGLEMRETLYMMEDACTEDKYYLELNEKLELCQKLAKDLNFEDIGYFLDIGKIVCYHAMCTNKELILDLTVSILFNYVETLHRLVQSIKKGHPLALNSGQNKSMFKRIKWLLAKYKLAGVEQGKVERSIAVPTPTITIDECYDKLELLI